MRSAGIRHLAGLLTLVVSTGCSTIQRSNNTSVIDPGELLLRDNAELGVADHLSADEARRDLDVLLFALRTGYGGRNYLEPQRFQNTLNQLESLRSQTSALSSSRLLCTAIDDVLETLPDNHLAASLEGTSCSKNRIEAIGQVGRNISAGSQRPWSTETRKAAGKSIAILSINRFEKHQDPSWQGFLDAVKAAMKADAIVIDLRGNPGGDDTMGFEMAELLFGGSPPSPIEFTAQTQTPAALAALHNAWKLRELRLRRRQNEVPDYIRERIRVRFEQFERARRGELPPEVIRREAATGAFNPGKGYSKPVFILIDRVCSSSCESTLETFEKHPFAKTVGESTNGDIHFAEAGVIVLPHSRIQFQMGTHFTKYRDGRFIERTGYTPAIRVPPGQDALARALEEIKKLP